MRLPWEIAQEKQGFLTFALNYYLATLDETNNQHNHRDQSVYFPTFSIVMLHFTGRLHAEKYWYPTSS